MSKYKAGLHKDVSSIFNGVSLPKNDNAQTPSSTPAAGHQDHNALKSPPPETPAQKPAVSSAPVQKQPPSMQPAQKPPVPTATVQKQPASAPPAQKQTSSETPAMKPAVSHATVQKQPASTPPAQKQTSSETPAQKPAVSHATVQKQPASAPPVQKLPSSGTPAPKPAAPEPSVAKSSASESPAQKPPAPSNITSTKPKSQQPHKDAKQPKAKTAAKSAGQSQWQKKLEMVKGKLLTPKEGVSSAKQKVMVVLIPVLFIALIFVFIRVFSQPQKVAGPKKPATAKVSEAAADKKIEWKVPEPYPTTLRDPMQFGPAAAAAQADQADQIIDTSGIVVKGIVYSEINPCAIIGDKILHQGDKVSGVTIVKISENSVEFEVNGKKWTQKVQR